MSVSRPELAARAAIASEMSLLVDIGSAWTKASVIARSRGRWRIAGHVAQPTAWGDEELRRSLAAHLAPAADRRVADHLEDLLAAAPRISSHTPRRAGRIALAGVSEELSAASALRGAESAGWSVEAVATADDGRSISERLAGLQAAQVDAWLLTGGFEHGRADQALEMASLVAVAREESGLPVIWAGASSLSDEVRDLFEEGAVSIVANPRPSAAVENLVPLRHALEELLQRIVEPAGTRQHTPVAFRRSVAELARSSVRRVVGVDVGARYLTWAQADEGGNAESRVFAAGGLGAARLVTSGGPGRLARWLPIALDELAVADALQNLHARPGTLPQTDDELVILHAAVRHLLAQTAGDEAGSELFQDADLLIGAGRTIAAAPRPAQAAQLLLDGIRPLGVTQLALDAAGALAPLGALEDGEIAEGMGALRDDLLVPLGTSVVTRGGRAGQIVMRAWLQRAGWPEVGPIEVRGGQLQVLPLARGHEADLQVELLNGATLGRGRPAARVHATVAGGLVGVILDARGIPLVLPRRSDDRRAVLAGWRDAFLREPSMPVTVASERDGAS